jgi:hypothetical protein
MRGRARALKFAHSRFSKAEFDRSGISGSPSAGKDARGSDRIAPASRPFAHPCLRFVASIPYRQFLRKPNQLELHGRIRRNLDGL